MSLTDTISAVQKKLGADADGKPGPETWAAIHLAVVGKKPAAGAGLDATIRAIQKKLGAFVDGSPGPETWGAIHRMVVGKKAPDDVKQVDALALAGDGKTADPRSERNIATLHPRVRPFGRALIEKAAGQGIKLIVISAMRTYAEQNKLYAQGRTKSGKKVTNAPAGYSNHNFGLAFDVGVFEGSTYRDESPKYKAVGALGTDLGLEWGGTWKSIQDEPHFQLRPDWAAGMAERDMLAELRRRKDSGKDFFA
jgi:peptidoglycan L-alanyl-D-glutamate endopeptidase CwlK